jgi:methionyl-tRNA formyltransferase
MDASPGPGTTGNRKTRVAVFGSFYRGFYLLNELLQGPISETVTVVGVATDNPAESFISADKRVWQYPHTAYEEEMVAVRARQHGIHVYRGKVNSQPFFDLFENDWKPELCVMGTFGQRIGKRLIDGPRLGFYNLHPCIDDAWPSKYAGGNPFEALMQDGQAYACVVMHSIDEGFDTGPFVARTGRIGLPDETTVTDMHKITAYAAAQLASRELRRIIAGRQPRNG